MVIKKPLIGRRREFLTESVDHHQIKVLLESGVPRSIVSKKIVEQLQLTIHPAPALAVCGAINGTSKKQVRL